MREVAEEKGIEYPCRSPPSTGAAVWSKKIGTLPTKAIPARARLLRLNVDVFPVLAWRVHELGRAAGHVIQVEWTVYRMAIIVSKLHKPMEEPRVDWHIRAWRETGQQVVEA